MEQAPRGFWRGRPIEELTREELIDALCQVAALGERDREQHARDLDTLLDFPRDDAQGISIRLNTWWGR